MGTPIKDATPIRRVYHINEKLPDGVRVSKTSVQDGDTFEIAYFTSGCAPTILRFTAGNRYKHFTYSGDEIIVHDAKTAGVNLQRRIRLNVMSEDGRPVTGLQVWCNDQSCSVKDGYVTLSSPDAHGAYHVAVGAYGYKPEKLHLTDDDINRGIVHVSLKTDTVTVPVKLYVNGTIIEDQVSLKGNSPLLPYLKEAQGDELNKHKFNTVYGADGRPMADGKTKDGHGGGKKPSKAKQLLALIGGLIAALYILYAIVFMAFDATPWPFNIFEDKKSAQVEQQTENPYVENDENTGEQQADDDTQESIDHDVAWMKKNTIWVNDSLQTQKYKTLCDYIAAGQVEIIIEAEEPWFNDKCNGYWQQIEANLKKIYANDGKIELQNEAKQKIRECSKDGKIKLSEMAAAIELVQKKLNSAPEPAKAEQQHPRKTQPKNVYKKNDGGKGGNKQGKEQPQKKLNSGV